MIYIAIFHLAAIVAAAVPDQICDGRVDCLGGGGGGDGSGADECGGMCARRKCDVGVRCETGDVCIRVPHRHVCNGRGRSMCPDGSDTSYCLHKIYAGCFVHSDRLGLSIAPCEKCFCRLKNHAQGNRGRIYKSISPSHRGSHVTGDVCLAADSEQICDGVEDCVGGADEAPEACAGGTQGSHRQSKSIEGEYAAEREATSHLGKLSAIVAAVVVTYAIVLVAACTWWKVKNGGKRDEQALLGNRSGDSIASTSSAAPVLAASDELYSAVAPSSSLTSNWSWNCARLVKELGKGFYGEVYLAEEVSGRLVAVKKRNRMVGSVSSNVFENEIRILLGMGTSTHLNVVQLLAYNAETETLVFEYCQHGNLKKFLTEHRSHFVDELDDVYASCNNSNRVSSYQESLYNLPMSDYLTTLHDKLDLDDSASTRTGTITRAGKLNTSRLVKWTRQIASGMEFLSLKNIVHGDLALRNVLLPRSDVAKISDFGLARKQQQPMQCDVELQEEPAASSTSSYRKSMPVAWMAPECLETNSSSKAGDVWSFGVTLWELFTLGETPYGDKVELEGIGLWLAEGNRLETPASMPRATAAIMTSCWEARPELRPTFRTIADTMRPGRRTAATLPRHFRGGTTDSGMSVSPSLAGSYLPMAGMRCDVAVDESSSVGTAATRSACYWNGYKIMRETPN